MKCPYVVNTKIITQIGFKHDADGLPVTQTAIENQESTLSDCIEGNCAAWQNGHCQYGCGR